MTSIFVAKLDFGVSEEELRTLFEEYGTVLKAHIAKDRETGKPRGFAFVEMADQEEAYAAIEGLNDHTINGRQLAVKEAEQRESNRPQTRSFEAKPARSESPGIISSDETPPQDLKDQGSKRGKKGRDTKKSGFGGGDRPRDRKMTAHKKSGKNKRIRFDDDEDEYVW
jgi:RNA recognition motif-containing protein